MSRQQMKTRLLQQRDVLRAKYSNAQLMQMEQQGVATPADLLQHSRDIVQFGPKNAGELYELSVEGTPTCGPDRWIRS